MTRTVLDVPAEICTGCAACSNKCPNDAIDLKPDATSGFLRPVVAKEKCCKCGICKEICPVLNSKSTQELKKPTCYAAWSKDEEIRFQSTSGGIFTHLANSVLNKGGVVVGAQYRENHLVEHTLIRDLNEIPRLRQSKYVQSEIGLIYRSILTELMKGSQVLFVGTPCQCAGLQFFLGRDFDNLYLCDFICRGVNSPRIYRKYLSELEDRFGSAIKQVWFKNKTYGWNRFATKITFDNGKEYLADREADPYMIGYIKSKYNLYMRPCCYQCKFKGINRSVDVTLGDFWNVEKSLGIQNTENGVSAVMIHSTKGKNLFFRITHLIHYMSSSISCILPGNQCLVDSVAYTEERKLFWEKINEGSFYDIITKLE